MSAAIVRLQPRASAARCPAGPPIDAAARFATAAKYDMSDLAGTRLEGQTPDAAFGTMIVGGQCNPEFWNYMASRARRDRDRRGTSRKVRIVLLRATVACLDAYAVQLGVDRGAALQGLLEMGEGREKDSAAGAVPAR